jgi:hypothetical protein
MKTLHLAHCAVAVIGLGGFSTVACARKEGFAPPADAMPPTTAAAPVPTSSAGTPTDHSATPTTVANKTGLEPASVKWADIKDLGFDTRGRFFAGLTTLIAEVSGQMSELTAKRATMKGNPNVKDWDFAMKEMVDAQNYLKATQQELSRATAETWKQQKEKIGRAWLRTQEAYAKVSSSTTS